VNEDRPSSIDYFKALKKTNRETNLAKLESLASWKKERLIEQMDVN